MNVNLLQHGNRLLPQQAAYLKDLIVRHDAALLAEAWQCGEVGYDAQLAQALIARAGGLEQDELRASLQRFTMAVDDDEDEDADGAEEDDEDMERGDDADDIVAEDVHGDEDEDEDDDDEDDEDDEERDASTELEAEQYVRHAGAIFERLAGREATVPARRVAQLVEQARPGSGKELLSGAAGMDYPTFIHALLRAGIADPRALLLHLRE